MCRCNVFCGYLHQWQQLRLRLRMQNALTTQGLLTVPQTMRLWIDVQSAPAIPYKAKTVWFGKQCYPCSPCSSVSVLISCYSRLFWSLCPYMVDYSGLCVQTILVYARRLFWSVCPYMVDYPCSSYAGWLVECRCHVLSCCHWEAAIPALQEEGWSTAHVSPTALHIIELHVSELWHTGTFCVCDLFCFSGQVYATLDGR